MNILCKIFGHKEILGNDCTRKDCELTPDPNEIATVLVHKTASMGWTGQYIKEEG